MAAAAINGDMNLDKPTYKHEANMYINNKSRQQ